MKKELLLLILLAQATWVLAQNHDNKEPYMVKQLSNEHITSAEAQTSGGSISAQGVDANARIEVYVHESNDRNRLSKEEIEKKLHDDFDLNISVSNGKVTAFAKQKHKILNWKNALSISFKLYLPKNASSNLSTSGGSITMSDLSGNEEFTTSGGSLSVDHLSGKTNGTTSGGSISVRNSTNDIDLTTSGGSIDASDCDGNLKLSTSGGSLDLKNLKGQIKASTSGGSIEGDHVGGELKAFTSGGSIHLSNLSCSLETSTSGGGIDVAMNEIGKYVRINNSGGNINLQLPAGKGLDLDLEARKINASQLANFDGRIAENEVHGKLNGGGVPVIVHGSGKLKIVLR